MKFQEVTDMKSNLNCMRDLLVFLYNRLDEQEYVSFNLNGQEVPRL